MGAGWNGNGRIWTWLRITTLYLPAGFHDYGIATVDELFVALVVGRCEFLCEYQDEIDEVYHGLFEKRI